MVLKQIYQNLRTISLLPSVRGVTRHAENLSSDGLSSIQQIYNNFNSHSKPNFYDPLYNPFMTNNQNYNQMLNHNYNNVNYTYSKPYINSVQNMDPRILNYNPIQYLSNPLIGNNVFNRNMLNLNNNFNNNISSNINSNILNNNRKIFRNVEERNDRRLPFQVIINHCC